MNRRDTRPVVDPVTTELLETRDSEASVGHSRRDDCSSRGDLTHVGEVCQESTGGLGRELRHLPGHDEAGAEDPCLLIAALRQLGATQAARKTEVVADQRARSGLTADCLALDDEGTDSLRRGVNGRSE